MEWEGNIVPPAILSALKKALKKPADEGTDLHKCSVFLADCKWPLKKDSGRDNRAVKKLASRTAVVEYT